MSKRMRLAWFAAVVFVAAFGVGSLAIWVAESIAGPSWWGIDATSVDAARRLLAGEPIYIVPTSPYDTPFLYPPLAALLALPLTLLGDDAAIAVIAAAKLAITVPCVAWLTEGWRTSDRFMAMVALVLSLPYLHDLFLGNTNILVVAAMVPALFGTARPRNGVLLGLAAAAFAKPLIVPVLLWLVVWRRPTFVGSIATAAIATLASLALVGPAAFADWLATLSAASRWLSTPFAGNHGVTSLVPEAWLPVAIATAVGLAFVLRRRGPRVALAWAATSGILLAQYAGTYAALPIALALPAIGPLAPLFALAIVAASPIGTTIPLPFYATAILIGALALREPARDGRSSAGVGLLTDPRRDPPLSDAPLARGTRPLSDPSG